MLRPIERFHLTAEDRAQQFIQRHQRRSLEAMAANGQAQ